MELIDRENTIANGIQKCKMRTVIVALMFFCTMLNYILRINLSIAIIAMTDPTINSDFEVFDWNEEIKSYLFSSFYWGYILFQIPGGYFIARYGSKTILLITMTLGAIVVGATPWIAKYGEWQTLLISRILLGLCQSFLFPAVTDIIVQWSPMNDRAQLGSYIYSGFRIGTALSSCLGVIAVSRLGWPGIFYIPAICFIPWCFLWYFFGSNSPSDNRYISDVELNFILKSNETSVNDNRKEVHKKTPWKAIFTSVPYLTILFTAMTLEWGFTVFLSETPTYMSAVLHFNITENSFLSTLPFMVASIISLICGPIDRLLIKHRVISLPLKRKLFNTIGSWSPVILWIGLTYVQTDKIYLAVWIIIVSVGMGSFNSLGFVFNHLDLAPNYGTILFGIENFAATFASIMAPLAVGWIVKDETNTDQWRQFFILTAFMNFIGNLVFLIYSRYDEQSWNDPKNSEEQQ